MNMFKKNGGFTLVELIVVIAILAILAAVAIPAYSGYITKAQDAAATTALGSIKTAALGAFATSGGVNSVSVFTDGQGKVTMIAVNTAQTDATKVEEYNILYKNDGDNTTDDFENSNFKLYLNEEVPELGGSYAKGAKWVGSYWEPVELKYEVPAAPAGGNG